MSVQNTSKAWDVSKRRALYRDVLLDTGPLVAILCEADQYHNLCAETLKWIVPPMLTTWPVLTEAAWILRDEPVALQRLYSSQGLFTIVQQGDAALLVMQAIAIRYQALRPQLADLSLLQLAIERELSTFFTVDRRDFTVYRVRGKRLRLLPELS